MRGEVRIQVDRATQENAIPEQPDESKPRGISLEKAQVLREFRLGFTPIQRRPKQLTENYIGSYSIDDLLLVIGEEQVRFSPRGRNIVGAAGRVDVVGERGEAALILQPETGWGFVEARQPSLEIMALDESSLAVILKRVMCD